MRFLGTGLIVVSCGTMGLIIASSYGKRVHNLRQLIVFIQLLESEIHFARTTLPEVISKQVGQFSGAMKEFLLALENDLNHGSGHHFSTIWEQGIMRLAENGLPAPILEDLRGIGKILGTSDVTEQTKHLGMLLVRLEQALEVATGEREKQTRLWQYLGFSAGLLIVLLLF